MDAMSLARFWSRVNVTDNDKECWLWRAGVTAYGYGEIRVGGKKQPAHRVAAALFMGRELEPGDVIMHRCDTPACCNPFHLVVGTHAENVADRVAKGRSAIGGRNGRAKLNEDMIREIRNDNRPPAQIARHYNVDRTTIVHIKTGRTWKHVA